MVDEEMRVEGQLALAGAGAGGGDGTPPEPRLDHAIQIRLGNQLRAMYAGLMTEPIPEHLIALIEKAAPPER